MKKVFVLTMALGAFFYGSAQKTKVVAKPAAKPAVAKAAFKNLIDSFSYAAGYNVANNMKAQKISRINPVIMQKAIDDVYKGKQPMLTVEQMNVCMQKQIDDFSKASSAAEIAKGVAFLDANKKRKEVTTLPSGLQYEVLASAPDSAVIKPRTIDTVVVNYAGTLIDGREFDNSYKRGQPAIFQVTGVIRGWIEILQMMRVGDKWKVYIPTELAYYLNPRDPNQIPPGAALIFEITLEGIKPAATQ
ncbi:FKBP-type peptidyl-prolyl cis-trans isomerase [Ferruginibacter sp.]|nr:FKBP-type peptidyl-prolyl cis-trans isomerase [Ferruginibacter sp.]